MGDPVHGCVGWVLCTLLPVLAMYFLLGVGFLAETGMLSDDLAYLLGMVALVCFPAGVLLGFCFFEIFAFCGVRRLRYVNHPARQQASDPPETPAGT